LLDEHYAVLEANAVAEALYGYTVTELRALRLPDLRAPQTRATAHLDMETSLREHGARWQTWHLRKDGTVFPVDVSSKPFMAGGRVRYVHIVRDATDRADAMASPLGAVSMPLPFS
ncbi:MAG TPA: PAS domain S-box protein, partial [Nitrospirales bacterium]|nr:PAS domain S-box protein [Nitrospirales bacterium]